MTASIDITVSKFSDSMKVGFHNNSTVVAYIRTFQARGTAVWRLDPVRVEMEDAASQAKYGIRVYPHPGEFVPNSQEATNWCGFQSSIYGDPQPNLTLRFAANASHAAMLFALQADLSMRITVKSNAYTRLGLNDEYFIEAVRHDVDAGGRHHIVTLECSPATGYGGFWVLGSSLTGEATKLGY